MHWFLRGLLNEWGLELQHLNPTGYCTSPASSLSARPSSGWSRTWTSFGGFSTGEPCPRGSRPESHRLGVCLAEEAEAVSPYLAYSPCDSNRGWHGEWFYIRNLVEVPFPSFIRRRPERRESWSWGPARRQNKLEIIEMEL